VVKVNEIASKQLQALLRSQKGGLEHDLSAVYVAWQQLQISLREANKLYLDRNDGGREAAVHQLSAVNQFIATVTNNDRLLQMPLFALNVALYYLNFGIVEPMLAPKGKSRRGRRPELGLLKIRSAVAMTQLYAIGYSRKEASRWIADELSKLGLQTSADAVADWRDNFRSHLSNEETTQLYRSMLVDENVFIGGEEDLKRAEADRRPTVARKIVETFRKYVLLARLTTNPNLSKVLPQLPKPEAA
jgi:hypothetical protein